MARLSRNLQSCRWCPLYCRAYEAGRGVDTSKRFGSTLNFCVYSFLPTEPVPCPTCPLVRWIVLTSKDKIFGSCLSMVTLDFSVVQDVLNLAHLISLARTQYVFMYVHNSASTTCLAIHGHWPRVAINSQLLHRFPLRIIVCLAHRAHK